MIRRALLLAPLAPLASLAQESIGTATMAPDGTIMMRLRATGAGGMVGDGLVSYPPGHPQYDMVLRHLGGLRPGETKPVRPFP